MLGLLANNTGRFTTVTHESMFEIGTVIPFSLQTNIREPFTHHKKKKNVSSLCMYIYIDYKLQVYKSCIYKAETRERNGRFTKTCLKSEIVLVTTHVRHLSESAEEDARDLNIAFMTS